MKFLFKKRIYVTFLILITIMFILFIRANMDYIKKVMHVEPLPLAALVALCFINRVLNGLKIKVVTGFFDVKLSFKEWYGLSVVNNFYNYFVSKSGTLLAATYVKKIHGFNYSKYLSFIMGDVILIFLAAGVLGFLSSFFGAITGLFDNWFIVSIFLCLTFVVMIIVLLPEIRFPDRSVLIKVNKILHGWNALRKNKKVASMLFILNITMMVVWGVRYYIIFRIFSTEILFLICLLIAPLNFIVQIVSIIPGAYGIRESVTGFITAVTNFGFTSGAVAALMDRAIMMSIAFIQGPIFSYILIRKSGVNVKEAGNE